MFAGIAIFVINRNFNELRYSSKEFSFLKQNQFDDIYW